MADVLEGRIHPSDMEYEGLAAEAYARSPSYHEYSVEEAVIIAVANYHARRRASDTEASS